MSASVVTRRVPLGEVAAVDRAAVSPDDIESGTLFVGLEHIANDGTFQGVVPVKAGQIESTKFRFDERHVLYGKLRPYLRKIARPTFSGICSTDILPILPGHHIDRNYLYYFLRTDEMIALANSRTIGANLPRLSPAVLETFEVPLPPLAEQRRIAAILNQADALRAKRRTASGAFRALRLANFISLFGDPATNPREWPVRKIGELLDSASYGTSEKAGPRGKFPVLRMNNITRSGEIDLSDLKYMDLAASDRERYLVRRGDVLFNRTNSADLVGKTALVNTDRPMAYAGYLIRLRVAKPNVPEFLAAFLNTPYAKAKLRSMCKSIIGMANINAKEIQAMAIPSPPWQIQREFAARIAGIDCAATSQARALEELETLNISLQQRAFRGEL